MCSPNCSMGTGQNLKGGVNNRLSLPHRRYSVPETVMRKYSLTRQRSAESTESGNATVPTPSVPSAGTDTRSIQMNDSTRRKTHSVNKACQTSPRSSLISSMSFSSSYKSAIRKQWDHKKKANSLDEASSKDTTDDSQLYFDANYKDSIEKYKTEILREISLPGEVILQKEETTKSIIITKSDEQICEDNEEKENMNDETQDIRDDVDNYVIEEDIKILLENITKDRTIKLLLGFRAKSFPERSEIHSVEDSKSKREIKSANGRLFSKEFKTKDDENALIENDSTLSNVKDLTQFDDTPSPQVQESPPQENSLSPPKSGHSSDQSAECYITDCDICTAEGRKCCSLDNSSEVFSFTSPDMVMTTNELKTSSEFTSTSVTLDQTVSDHSTSTQDSTLSITSITPESYNSNSNDSKNMLNNQDRITPSAIGLVINSETTILDPILSKESTKNLNYNLSDSEGSEKNKHSEPLPLVLTSETIVMEPIQCDTSKTHCVLEMMETDSTITEGSERTQQQLETTDDNENKIEINEGEADEKMYDSLEINKEVSLTESAMNSDDQKRIINPNKLKVLNIFLNRKIDFRQSTGSAIIEDNNGFQNESIIRSMSCGELQNDIDLQNNNNVELNGKDYENNLDDEGDLLEQLGFKEEPKSGLGSGRTSSSFLELCGRRLSYDEMCKKQMQDMFYGNKTYEVITNVNNNNNNSTTSDVTRRNIMGNVMSTSEESLKSYYHNKKPPQRQEAEINSSHVSFSSVTNINNLNEDDGRLSGYTISQQEMNCDGKCNDESDETICGNVIMLRIPLPTDEDGKPIPTCLEGSVIENTGKELIIPRYSAMPRTVSMLVNTSSADYSSDSELSLADSLEDITSSEPPNSNETQTWTNKHDNRLVRGDVISLLPENNKKLKRQKTNEAYAYFVSLSGEMGEIKTETIPENLKQKLMKRDNEIRRHIDHHHFHHHHHPRRKDRRFESLFKKTLKKKAPQLSQSDFYDSSSKEEVGKLRKAYSLTSADSEERLIKQDSKFTQWEENPEPQKKILQEVDEENVIKEQKESKWLKCNQLIKSDPELDKIVSDVILASLLTDQQQLDLDEEIKDILLEALKEDDEHAKDSNKSPEGTEEQVVPIKKNGDDKKSDEQPTHKSISIQTAESSLHVNACESFEYCELCHQNNIKEDKLYENGSKSDDFLKNDSLNLQAQKDPMEKIDNLITNNLKSVCRDKLGGTISSAKSQQQTLDISIPVPNRKIINQSKGEKTMTKHKPPHGVSDKSKVSRSPRSHSCINLNNNTNKQPIRPHPVKVPQSRRSANTLGVRFQQKFEAIPEEKSGSMESSEEQKSPKPSSSRRLSIPTDILLLSKDSKKNIQKNRESNINKDLLEPTTSNVSHDQGRRHTIHGNIQDGEPYRDKTDQSRRHTVHGNINVNAGQISGIRRINLNVGTIMRGQVIGQRGNVMIGRFRPLNDETQVEKDENEKILIGEIERIRRKMCKGKEALETSKSEEQEELLTLSKGWINFYLLRESGEFSSDHSINDDDSSNSPTSNETIGRVVPPLQTVNIVDKPEDKVHQYTVQIRATEEPVASYSPCEHESKLPDLNKSRKRSPRSSSESPDVTLPDIPAPSPVTSPTSTKSRTPTFSEITSQQNEVLPQLHSGKRSILSNSKTKSSAKKYITTIQEQKESSSPTSDQGYNYLHLPSPHSEVQSRSPNTPCQEISPITPSSSTCDSRSESPVLPSIKWPMRQIQRRHIHRYQRTDIGRQQPPLPIHPVAQSSGTCWTVTVAGNSGNPQQPPPDVEMRLSFQSNQQQTSPNQQQHHLHQQEPYTTVHNSNNVSSSQIIQETKERRLRRSIQDPIPTPTPPQPCWSLTVKNKNQGEEREGRKSHHEKSSKRSAKKGYQYKGEERSEEEERQFSFIWPKVEEILDHGPIRKPSMNSVQWNSSDIQELSVTGLAITPEKKPRVPTMSERDLTRVHYSRTKLF